MKTSNNTVLITGGATGIGFALTEAFIDAGNRVLICGRRRSKLEEARQKLPQIQVRQCDLSKREDRESLCSWVKDRHDDLNILVNNAGIQRAIDIKKGTADLLGGEDEVHFNFVAPMHLSAYLTPLLMDKKEAAIINVSSGLACQRGAHSAGRLADRSETERHILLHGRHRLPRCAHRRVYPRPENRRDVR